MTHLTVRNLPPAVAKALEREKRASGLSLNQTVIRVLARALGLDPEHKRSNGLAKLAGGWSERDLKEFNEAIAPMEEIDPELWR